MLKIEKSIEQGFGGGGLYDILKQLQQFGIGVKGEVFFVDNNMGSNSPEAGKSWEFPFKTLSYAIGVSNTSIARGAAGWASRNTILLRADSMAEDLTVFPAKCDVIGCGSTHEGNKTRIIGEHTETGDGVIQSTAWYNIDFRNDDASPIFLVTTFSGLYFYDCSFTAEGDSINAIKTAGACDNFVIKNCEFRNDGSGDPFDTAAIEIVGAMINCKIEDCYVEGDIGIIFTHSTATNCLVNNCVIKALTLCLDDDSSLVVFTNNCFITAANGGTPDNVVDVNVKLGANNVLTDNDTGTISFPTLMDLVTYTG